MDGDYLRYNNDHSVLGTLGNGELVPLTHADRRQHVYLIGKTGTGKSTLLFNLMLSDLHQGRGFALLDPHGDLAHAVADAVPAERTNEVLYFDPADLSHPVAFNPLERVHPDRRPLVAAHIGAAFKHLWGDSWGPRLEYILDNSLRLLLDAPGSTLLGLPRLLADDKYRARLLATCSDPVIRAFWQREFAEYHDRFLIEAIAPVQNKIGALLSPPAIRNVVGQQRSTLNIPHLMNTNRVLIANLSKGRLGEAPAHLLGAFLATAFAQSAESRADIPEHERQDFTLYADEFQSFITDSFAAILSEMRKWRLSLALSHQFLGQLPRLLRQAVIGNAGTVISFRLGAEDAALIADELGLANPEALTDTPNFAAWIKLMYADSPRGPHYINTLPGAASTSGRLPAIQARTRARHARPREQVEEQIAKFLLRSEGNGMSKR
ncbi:MAG: type IV secretory system conjugative DNA transfer family protein [Xanthobacteraceae bacterium]